MLFQSAVDLVAPGLSTAREKVLEHRFISDLAAVMLRRGVAMDVLRSEMDAQGHDLVLEAGGITRHVQLKATVEGGKRRHVDINVRLRSKPSGCVIWMSYDPSTLALASLRWFGAPPAEPLPGLGSRVTKHSKGDSAGSKAHRPALRNLPRSRFESVVSIDELADRLFGPSRSEATMLILAQLRRQFGTSWLERIRATLRQPTFDGSIELAHLVDGYSVLEQLCEVDPPAWLERVSAEGREGRFPADLGLQWTQLFLEHRRWRFASPAEPSPGELKHLDDLAARLRASIEVDLLLEDS